MMGFKNWKIRYKIWSLVVLFIVAICISGVFSAITLKKRLIEEKKIKLASVVDTAYGVLNYYYTLSKNGLISEEDAKQAAILAIKSLRYQGKEYFWINDDTLPYPKMIMHPTASSLEGKVLNNPKYNCATMMQEGKEGKTIELDGKKNLFQAMVEVCNKAGEGYVVYQWPKPLPGGGVTKESYPKLSYVKKFEPWGWIIGSGVYIDDVNAVFYKELGKLFTGLVVISIILLSVSYFISRAITSPIGVLLEAQKKISEGDLTVSVPEDREDEIGIIAKSINQMVKALKEMVERISLAVKDVELSAGSLSQKIAQEEMKAVDFSEQMQRIASAVEEMSITIADIAKNASSVSDLATQNINVALEGENVSESATNTILKANENTMRLKDVIAGLNKSADEIGYIVQLIKDIADQTNLLALNATIEAARAGEHGKGFAVVAEEIRKLADRTLKATEEITEKVSSIQSESSKAFETMEITAVEVEKAVEALKNLKNSLDNIVESSQKVKDSITQVAAGTEEQSIASEEVAKNVEEISKISREREKIGQELSADIETLSKVAETLKQIMKGFRL
jgi:methyl-accepting chemotaxis protein